MHVEKGSVHGPLAPVALDNARTKAPHGTVVRDPTRLHLGFDESTSIHVQHLRFFGLRLVAAFLFSLDRKSRGDIANDMIRNSHT